MLQGELLGGEAHSGLQWIPVLGEGKSGALAGFWLEKTGAGWLAKISLFSPG